jgi:excisionase family DNA binding protein
MTPYRRVHRGEIPAVMLPGGWLFDRQDIERFVKSRTVLPSRTAG